MRNTTLTPENIFDDLFRDLNRIAIGFEPTLRQLYNVRNEVSAAGHPPYNLEQIGDDHYRITLAVAGFTEEDLDVQVHNNQLIISGQAKDKDENRQWLYKGIAGRAFTRTFTIADHVRVEGANLDNGLLTVDLIREVPEALKPRKIEIGGPKMIEGKA